MSRVLRSLLAAAVTALGLPGLPGQPVPAAAARSGGIVVVAAGDIACRPGSPPTAAGCQQRATARAVLAQHPRAVLLLGDNQYRTKGAAGYYRYFGHRAAAPVRPWYSFRLGTWHLVALNSNCG